MPADKTGTQKKPAKPYGIRVCGQGAEQERNKSGAITIIIKIINIIKTIIIINPEAQIHIALLMLKLLKIRYMRDTEKRHCKIGKTVDIFK